MKKIVVLLLLVLPVALFALISYLGHNIVKPTYTPVEAVEFKTSEYVTLNNDSQKIIVLDKGMEHQLAYEVLPYIATQKKVSFITSDSNYVTVDETGKIKAMEYTTNPIAITVITDVNQKQDYVYVTVSSTIAREVRFQDGEEIDLELLDTYVLEYEIYPLSSVNHTSIEFTSSDDRIVSVDQNGLIKALNQGEVIITITTNNNLKDTIKVNARLGYTGYLPENDVVTVKNTYVFPRKSGVDNYVWEIVEGGEYAEIDSVTGVITFHQKNQPILVRFTNLDDDSVAEVWIESVEDIIKTISIDDKISIDMSIRVNGEFKLNPQIFPKDATMVLSYQVINGTSFISVDSTGNIKANGNGKGTVRISSAETYKDVEVEVICPPFNIQLEEKYRNASNLVGSDGIALGINQKVDIEYVISRGSYYQVETDVEVLLLDTNVMDIKPEALESLRLRSQAIAETSVSKNDLKFSITPKLTGKYHLSIVSKANTQGKVTHSQLYLVEINEGINVSTYEKLRELFDNQSLDKKLIINLLGNIDANGELWDNWTKSLIDPNVEMSHDFTVFMVQNYAEINGNSFEISVRNLTFRTDAEWIKSKDYEPNVVMFRTFFYGEYSSNNQNGIKSQLIINHTKFVGNSGVQQSGDLSGNVAMIAFYTGNNKINNDENTIRGSQGTSDLFSLKKVTVERFNSVFKINNMDKVKFSDVLFSDLDGSVGYFSQCRDVKMNNISMYDLRSTGIEFLETGSDNCGYTRGYAIDQYTKKEYQYGEQMNVEITGHIRISCWAGISDLEGALGALMQSMLSNNVLIPGKHVIKLDSEGKYVTGNAKSNFIMMPFLAAATRTETSTLHPGNHTIIKISAEYIDEIKYDLFVVQGSWLGNKGLDSRLFVANIGGNAAIMDELMENKPWPALNT